MLRMRMGAWCSVGVIQRFLEIHGIVVVSRRVADDVSAMGCVFGLEELAHPLWDENGCLV